MLCFTLYLRAIFRLQAPRGLYLEGLIHGGAYFRNFTVSVRRNKYYLEFSVAWIWLKNFRWAFHSGTIFDFLKKFLYTIFWSSEVFTFHSQCYRLIFGAKRKPKIFGFKDMNMMECTWGIRKNLTFLKRTISSKLFGKRTVKPL